ncbi:hypothetical protein VTK56DRAFT_656 [Thermocarpiscus australiensis]
MQQCRPITDKSVWVTLAIQRRWTAPRTGPEQMKQASGIKSIPSPSIPLQARFNTHMADIDIRAATEADMPSVARINEHYVLNTVMTFATETHPLQRFIDQFREIAEDGLPYLVAVARGGSSQVLGYTNAHAFRRNRGAYKHTVEITVFCDPAHTGNGIGSRLVKTLLDVLREPARYPELRIGGMVGPPPDVRQVIAVMSVDEKGKRNGLALKEFYESFGFSCNGHLRQVGYKFGRWVDTMYLQLSL